MDNVDRRALRTVEKQVKFVFCVTVIMISINLLSFGILALFEYRFQRFMGGLDRIAKDAQEYRRK